MKVLGTKTLTVPEYPGSKVEILDKTPWGAYEVVKDGMTEYEMATKMLPTMIVSWNFNDQDDKELPVTEENIRRLPRDLVVYLLKEGVTGTKSSLKKKTSDESPPSSKDLKSE